MSLKAVIFDVDGTLADTEEAHRQAFNASFRAHGLPWEWDAPLYRELLAVTGGKERMRHYCERFHPAFLSRPDAGAAIAGLHADKTRRYAELVAQGGIPARPGILRMIRELQTDGVRLAIATTTSRANVAALLATSLSELAPDTFAVIGAGEDAFDKKPSPAVYAFVLERLALAPEDCLAIEDSRNGLRAAQAAGLPVLITECPWTAGEDFAGALAVLPDLGAVDAARLRRWHDDWRRAR
jgi:HAD superfamily hydrolase (TIGR01509 family)